MEGSLERLCEVTKRLLLT